MRQISVLDLNQLSLAIADLVDNCSFRRIDLFAATGEPVRADFATSILRREWRIWQLSVNVHLVCELLSFPLEHLEQFRVGLAVKVEHGQRTKDAQLYQGTPLM